MQECSQVVRPASMKGKIMYYLMLRYETTILAAPYTGLKILGEYDTLKDAKTEKETREDLGYSEGYTCEILERVG